MPHHFRPPVIDYAERIVANDAWRRPPPRRTLRDDLSDFLFDLRADPTLTFIVFGAGFASGTVAVVGMAFVIAKVTM